MSATVKISRWQRALEKAFAQSLPAFLPGQRWFGGKARQVRTCRVEDCVWLREGDEPLALVIAHVDYAIGSADRYVMLLALRHVPGALPSLGTIAVDGETRHLLEATTHPPDALVLLRHLDRSHELTGAFGGTLGFGDLPVAHVGAFDAAGLREEQVRGLGAEQSNTSLRVGPGHVFKLIRRFESGENPEVEIGRYFSHHGSFHAAPALRASLSWHPANGEPGTLGALQDLIVNQGDGWQWALRSLEEVFSLAAAPEPLVSEILTLGAITAEMHAALAASPDAPGFAPRPAGPADVHAWETAFRERADRVLAMITAGLDGMGSRARGACEGLLRLRARLDAAARLPAPTDAGAFVLIRLHGDYHLGQTLKTAHGFAVIDFEGEPARPLAERRLLHCALKDVSGMLRSFDYAIETARSRAPEGVAWTAAPPPLRETFLRGYDARAEELGAPHLPLDLEARARWTAFFELEKALYEMEYELQNRPAWLHIPACGVLRLLEEVSA